MGKNGNWRGGESVREDGYIQIRVNGKPKLKHRHLMELHLGRPLEDWELVHHENGDKTDNRIENLRIHTSSTHMKHHHPHGPKKELREITCVICGASFKGLHHAVVCSEVCRKIRQRQYFAKYRLKRSAKRALIAEK
jgi:predicted nucleic acid-binding Zn ribbon protein